MPTAFHPKSFELTCDPEITAKLSSLVQAAATDAGWLFSCDGVVLTAEELGGQQWLLSVILWRAMDWMEEAFGERPGLAFRVDPKNICGASAEPVAKTAPLALWAMFVHFTLDNEVRRISPKSGEAVPLDNWYSNWREAILGLRVNLLPSIEAPATAPAVTPAEPAPVQG
jgi:hypothetical protein